ncbi:MAG TPA: MFS transporter [Pseudomonadota bacterium]|nr:MFS transporter [Pseudomonadota bacterium]HND13118.1 MFS transporter [Pseudomonadota bacterium]HNI60557.1 MFS transporter [Pseudomonadota bacterium]HNK45217.1 MFS transporter [Pseudomonadota bacterium]HNN51060.1 MFS transporter [Pseudomonadota bacterium]
MVTAPRPGPDPLPPSASSAELLTPEFRLRRFQNWFFLGLMYGFFYMSRYNLGAVQSAVAEQFGWSHDDYGTITSAGLATYGCAVFLNGPLADRIGGKRAILIGAAGAAFFNLLFGLCHLLIVKPAVMAGGQVISQAQLGAGLNSTSVIAMFAVLWACNHYFQSFGALSIVKINAAWFRVTERGKFAGIFGIMIQLGRTLAMVLLPALLLIVPWQYAFFVPALLLTVIWGFCYFLIQNTPALAGHGEFDTGDESPDEARTDASLGFVLRKVFTRKAPWIIALASFCIGSVRHVVDGWYPRYISSMFDVGPRELFSFAPYQMASVAMPFAAVVGGLVAGNASDRLFQSRRAPVIFFAFLGMAVCMLSLRGTIYNPWGAAVVLIAVSFFVQSAHSLVGGAASMDFGGRKAVATAAGLFDGAQYLGGALAGKAVGKLLLRYKAPGLHGHEFEIWPYVPLIFAVLGALIISRLWNALPGRGGHGAPIAKSGGPTYPLTASLPAEQQR